MQKTTFPIEIIIHDDASTDATTKIIQEYANQYPELFVTILQKENQWSKYGGSMFAQFVFPRARGKFIALCEGDDYWSDPYKLQKQVDFLEANEKYSFCFHNATIYYCDTGLSRNFNHKLKSGAYTTEDLLLKWIIPTASLLFRRVYLPNPFPDWYYSVMVGDYPLELLLSTNSTLLN